MCTNAGRQLDPQDLLALLEVARKLSAPFELNDLLSEIIDAGRRVFRADRGTVFLYDPQNRELHSAVATGVQGKEIRFSIDKGIAGDCARERAIVNVPDCYADPRFNPEIDRKMGYRTNCLITVPLVGLDDELVGVMQLLNAEKGRFDEEDERLAVLLGSEAAAAIQRVMLLEARLDKIKMENDLNIARSIQMGVLPQSLPRVAGYELAGFSRPADQTGGDIYDVVALPERVGEPADETDCDRVLMLLADATGHGIGPALSVTSVRAMLRMGLRLTNDLDQLFVHINGQLSDDLPGNRFVTAFLGVLEASGNRVQYQSAGQGPLLHFKAASCECVWHGANTIPWGIMGAMDPGPSELIGLAPGDMLVLLTDGFYECQNSAGEQLGKDRIGEVVHARRHESAQAVLDALIEAVETFAGGELQGDDLTALVVRRLPG